MDYILKNYWESAFDSLPDMVSLQTKNHKILKANKAFNEFVHESPGSVVGKKCYELIFNRTIECENCPAEKTIANNFQHNTEIAINDRYFIETTGPIYDEEELVGIIHSFKDITKLKQTQFALEESKTLYKDLFNTTIAGILVNKNATIINANKQAYKLYGYDFEKQDLNGLTPLAVIHPDDVQLSIDNIKKNATGSNVYKSVRKDGSIFYAAYQGSYTIYKGEKVRITTFTDVTEAIVYKQKLEESELRYKNGVIASSLAVWDRPVNPPGEEWWSPKIYEILGYDETEVEASLATLAIFVHPADKDEIFRAVENQKNFGCSYDLEYRVLTKSEGYKWVHSRSNNILDDSGNIISVAGSIYDITARKIAEKALKDSEEKNRNIVDKMLDGLLIIRHADTMQILFANQAVLDISGYTQEEILTADYTKLFDTSSLELVEKNIDLAKNTGDTTSFETIVITKNGERKNVIVSGSALNGSGNRVILIHDVTELKKRDNEIKKLKETMRLGEILVKEELITNEQLRNALIKQTKS